MDHDLRIWPTPFRAVRLRQKRYELRRDDRNPRYEIGDLVTLREFDPVDDAYTGFAVSGKITYVCRDFEGLKPGYCIFNFELFGEGKGI